MFQSGHDNFHSKVIDLIDAKIYEAQSAQEIEDLLAPVMDDLGVDEYSCNNCITDDGEMQLSPNGATIFGHFDTPWRAHYIKNQYYMYDNALHYCLYKVLPRTWKSFHEEPMTDIQKKVFAEATEYGLNDGAMIPIHSVGCEKSTFSMSGEYVDFTRSHLLSVQLLVSTAHAVLKERHGKFKTNADYNLSPLQQDILSWVNERKSNWEISKILSDTSQKTISHIRVKREMKDIYDKLGVGDRTEALVLARTRGLFLKT
jgi:DNA-binding CsgD family transcriptional regulator